MRKEGGKWQRMELYQCINPMQSAISFYLVGDLSAKSCRWKNRVKFRLSRYFAQGRGLSSFSNWKRNATNATAQDDHWNTSQLFSLVQRESETERGSGPGPLIGLWISCFTTFSNFRKTFLLMKIERESWIRDTPLCSTVDMGQDIWRIFASPHPRLKKNGFCIAVCH